MPGEPEDGWKLGKCPRLRAVDRRMLILEATENGGSGRRIADLVFFAVHPTVLIHNAPLFNSDFTGYAMDASESKYMAASKRRVWVTTAANEIVDETDFGFIKILKQAPAGDCQTWSVIWLGPLLREVQAVDYVFHVKTSRGATVKSKPFRVNLSSSSKPVPVEPDGQASCK